MLYQNNSPASDVFRRRVSQVCERRGVILEGRQCGDVFALCGLLNHCSAPLHLPIGYICGLQLSLRSGKLLLSTLELRIRPETTLKAIHTSRGSLGTPGQGVS